MKFKECVVVECMMLFDYVVWEFEDFVCYCSNV